MESFIIYLVKVAVCLGIFLSVYVIFLRKTTFLIFKRYYLLLGFVVSLILPSLAITYDVIIPLSATAYSSAVSAETAVLTSDKYLDLWSVLAIVYVAGMLLALTRNGLSYMKVYKLIKNGIRIRHKNYTIVESPSIKSAFTVLDYILLNPRGLSKTEKDLVLKHELIHINQRHWIDLLCSECMLLLQWFNPLAWIYVRLLKENHEFLADKAVLDSGVSPHVYRAVLVNQEFEGTVFSFSSSFNYSKSLNRLSMMKKEKSASWKRLATLAVVPLFGLFLWASAKPNYIMKDFSISKLEETFQKSDSVKPKVSVLKGYMGHMVNQGDSSYIQLTAIPGGDIKNVLVFVDGVEESGEKLKTSFEDVDNISVLKGKSAIDKYGEKGKNGVILITTKKGKEEGVPLKGKIAGVKSEGADNKNVLKGEVTVIKHGGQRQKGAIPFNADSEGSMKDALLFVDGKKVSTIDDIKPEDIESMTVLKGEAAIEKYGEDGKNGVIHIKVKKKGLGIKDALILVNGKKVESLDDIDKNEIESISILKDKSATAVYGEEGKNGVVLVETKKK